MASLVLQSGASAGRVFPLAEGLNRLGRAPGNEIRVEAAGVSASHCELWLMRSRVLVRDLGSTNGTFVQGGRITEAELGPDARLSVGGLEFSLEGVPGWVTGSDGNAASGPSPSQPVAPAPMRRTLEGDLACANHASEAAAYRCPKCGEAFCAGCVRTLARRGGRPHAYCPQCHAECVSIPSERARVSGSVGWFAKLTQTLRLGRVPGRPTSRGGRGRT